MQSPPPLQQLKDRPEGSRHVVFITDGVDTPGGKVTLAQAMKQMSAARATVHIVSYTEYVRAATTKEARFTMSSARFQRHMIRLLRWILLNHRARLAVLLM